MKNQFWMQKISNHVYPDNISKGVVEETDLMRIPTGGAEPQKEEHPDPHKRYSGK